MADECELSIFVHCSPICSDVSIDPELEALQVEFKRPKSDNEDQANDELDEAQSALRSLLENNVAKGTSENPPSPPSPPPPPPPPRGASAPVVTEENPRKRRGRPPKMVAVQETDPEQLEARPSWLPPGWVVERRTRANGKSAGHVDKYYIELSTQNRCRSKGEVQHYMSMQHNEQEQGGDDSNGASC